MKTTSVFSLIAVGILVFSLFARGMLPDWFYVWPEDYELPFQAAATEWLNWFLRDMPIAGEPIITYTRQLSALLAIPLKLIQSVLAIGWLIPGETSAETYRLPPLSWLSILAVCTYFGYRVKGTGMALLVSLTLIYFAVFGLWAAAMLTLASVVIIVILGFILGVGIGILGWRYSWVEKFLNPIFDVMQTMPVFSYLVPILLLFGFGPVAAIVVTLIFSLPPMARATLVALKQVPSEIDDAAAIAGANGFQRIFKYYVPSARNNLMIGLNQMIMASLAMVMLASLIGAGGLGGGVLEGLQRLRFGQGLEAGMAISLMAIALYRLGLAIANRRPNHETQSHFRRDAIIVALMLIVPTALGFLFDPISAYPEDWTITTEVFWKKIITNINVAYGASLENLRINLVVYVLNPFLNLLRGFGWAGAGGAMLFAGLALRRPDLGIWSLIAVVVIAWLGYWDLLLMTLHLVIVGILVATLIGVPLGIWSASSDRVRVVSDVIIDTIQTLPTLVYLVPIVMLLGPGNVTAVVAIAAYVVATIIRYTDHSLRAVPLPVIEAAEIAGATKVQELVLVRIPIALPNIMLGLNQAVLLGVGMVVVTALVGTKGLEQETISALSRVDPGRGLVAGLVISVLAIIIDRYVRQYADNRSNKSRDVKKQSGIGGST